jgi:hypothetical protein
MQVDFDDLIESILLAMLAVSWMSDSATFAFQLVVEYSISNRANIVYKDYSRI